MTGFFEGLEFWHWLVLGVALAIIEIFAPGAFLLWLGISAGIVGIVLWLIPELSWEYQLLIFAILSVASVVVARRYLTTHPLKTDLPNLNLRGQQYVGRTFTLSEPVVNGQGKIRVDDSTWKISCEDCEAGTKVIIEGVDGVVLRAAIADRAG
ncbi:MAG: NfeD family protein [Gammaproteobacteria bacterium]|nr:NfeD family protein [Gammaproteobacteria bacterium]NIM72231.1 NfeD family protein [Gammaproteobacteria bacterium]NIN39146.1 NfeD family protein [Gammaproteobacteria bacterium]NIO23979.1 NfeD family protein [Gammaproteobacteria bacterium]NIO64631.1 NfeD family protein [Gammaproteobacteria bacterium]